MNRMDELEEIARKIEEGDCGDMGEWADGFASGLRQAASIVRKAAEGPVGHAKEEQV